MIGWLDCAAGASGDMLLGALVDAGVPVEVLQDAVNRIGVEPIILRTERVSRHGIGATKVHVEAPHSHHHRGWRDIRQMLSAADLAADVQADALNTFERLARAEGAVHRVEPDDVHFHEVGALDAIADVVGVCAGFRYLGLESLWCGPVTLGSGMARGEHGLVPVPGPAVLALFADTKAVVHSGSVPFEACTPTGAALLASLVDNWGPLPRAQVREIGYGAGTRDPDSVPNFVRLIIGEPAFSGSEINDKDTTVEPAIVLSANIDDLDPRIWPSVLTELLAAGASDAWLTPIVMKKGRLAHTLNILSSHDAVNTLRRMVFELTSTIGLRESTVDKRVLRREFAMVEIDGCPIRVKIARVGDNIVNASVEYDDAAKAASQLRLPVKTVLSRATAAAVDAGLIT